MKTNDNNLNDEKPTTYTYYSLFIMEK